jgi:cytochrome P450
MASSKRIEDLPVMSELVTGAWGGDFPWVTEDLHNREYQGLLASPWGDGVIVYRNEDVVALQKHPSVAHQTLEAMTAGLRPEGSSVDKGLSGFMKVNSFSHRPPEHRPLKALTSERLTPATLNDHREDFRSMALAALRAAAGKPTVDCFEDVAKAIVRQIWPRLLGLTPDECSRLIELALDLARRNELTLTDEVKARCNASMDGYMELLTGALHRSAASGEYRILNALVEAHASMGPVGCPRDPLAAFGSAIVDGFATLPHLLSTSLWAVDHYGLDAPSDGADVDRWAASVFSEVSRMHPPVLATVRQVSEAFDYEGVHLPEGVKVWMLWMFANRDPAAFPNPMEFQLERPRRKQVTFSSGAYACSGLNVVRIVTEELLKAVALSGATVTVEGQPSWSSGSLSHHLHDLHVSVSLP